MNMKLFLLTGVAILLSGCAFSYSSNFKFQIGDFKVTSKEETTEQIQQPKQDNVLSETRVGE